MNRLLSSFISFSSRPAPSALPSLSSHRGPPHMSTRSYAECNEPTAVTCEFIEQELRAKMDVHAIAVRDDSGNGSFFSINIQSKEFNDLTMLKQHQMVNALLAETIKNVHGLRLNTKKYLPEE
eukprot:TRINITY_DN3777_c0_g1_i1.p2 TRINITY_DN3777_c0_g1~~TRINITY_DN3777_c0_g1_i1.p2  ORF type:complete len:140 (+),score=39.54 TRINITY_DN3777_c0_g1_i1:54-422(+)